MFRFCGLVVMTDEDWESWLGEMEYHHNVAATFEKERDNLAQNYRRLWYRDWGVLVQARLWKSRYLAVCKAAGIDPKEAK